MASVTILTTKILKKHPLIQDNTIPQGEGVSPHELVMELRKVLSATKIKFKESDFCVCL